MGNRLTKIYTRTGDGGTTGLADGSRVSKDAPRIEAIGAVDELNSALGVLLAEPLPDAARGCLDNVQNDLFDLGGELSVPGHPIMGKAHVVRLERELDRFNAGLPALKDFILPAGSRAAALTHLARTVCRRAERELVGLSRTETIRFVTVRYVNRLSDYFFVVGRAVTHTLGYQEVLWTPGST